MPYHAGGVKSIEPYMFRSSLTAPHAVLCVDVRVKEQNYELLRRLTREWREIAGYYLGDYYPLTSYSLDTDQWMAWQFDLPEAGEGMVQAFRRQHSPHEAARYHLRNLDPDAAYVIGNFDEIGERTVKGSELTDAGLEIAIKSRPGSAIVTYKRKSVSAN